jgi:hypothetical protein
MQKILSGNPACTRKDEVVDDRAARHHYEHGTIELDDQRYTECIRPLALERIWCPFNSLSEQNMLIRCDYLLSVQWMTRCRIRNGERHGACIRHEHSKEDVQIGNRLNCRIAGHCLKNEFLHIR